MTPNVDAQMEDRSPEALRIQLIEDLQEAHAIMLRALKNIAVTDNPRFSDYAQKTIREVSFIYRAQGGGIGR